MQTLVLAPPTVQQPAVETSPRPFAAYAAECSEHSDVRRGIPMPLGAHEFEDGVNFALFSRHATRVRLELFRAADESEPTRAIDLDPTGNRTGDVWHVWIKDIFPGQLYAYRVDGPAEPRSGRQFDFDQLLLDPFALAIERPAAPGSQPKCVFLHEQFDWGDDKPLCHPWSQTVIYETHVRGLTAHPSSQVRFPGTFRGLTEKIPYLVELGITAVELMPVQEFDTSRCRHYDPGTGQRLREYWGYDSIALFAPNGAYSSAGAGGQQRLEFKEMVRQLHAAGIEVILDIVLDHTVQPDEQSRTQHPVTRQLVIGALRHWATDMHVDGFRFEPASIVGRARSGVMLCNPALLEQIAEDPVLRDRKLIATGWRDAGAYRVKGFPHRPWAEWNIRYRDDVRRFWRGDAGMLASFASRLCGSEDCYGTSGKGPEAGINFVTCHDGFTLEDLVSFAHKHNEANGELDLDGAVENFSANYGAEGPSADARVDSLRKRQIKNFLLTLFVSRGVPMLLGGDELRRTQGGNNNAHCQDNETSWYDWDRLRQHTEIHEFVKSMIAFRRCHPVLTQERFYTSEDVLWLSPHLGTPDWSDPHSRTVGCVIRDGESDTLCLMFNAENKGMPFLIPDAPPGREWRLVVDTSTESPVCTSGARVEGGRAYSLASRSSVALVAARK